MLEVKSFVFGPFQTNTYVISDGSGQVFLIDPACSNTYEQQVLHVYIKGLHSIHPDIRVSILATHGHLDHLWGAAWACEQYHSPVLIHEADMPMVEAMQQQYDLFGIRAVAQPFPIAPLSLDNDSLPFRILHTPGHTPGSVCLYWPEEKTLLSGDTLFRWGYGRTDLPGGDYGQLMDSLDSLFRLPADVKVFSGHGEPTTIGAEKH